MNKILKNILLDCKNFKLNNEREKLVANAYYFSAYKGKLVFRTNRVRSASFGVLFITRKGMTTSIEDIIRHEYGHTEQLRQLGIIRYLLFIGIPSWKEWKREIPYYERPWEITADLFGGVKCRRHSEEKLSAGIDYLLISKKCRIIGRFLFL